MEYSTVEVRTITKEEKESAEDFQKVLTEFYNTFKQNKGRLGLDSFRDYQNLKKSVMRYHNRPWFERLRTFFSKTDKSFKEYFDQRRTAHRTDPLEISNLNNRALELFKSGNIEQIIQMKLHISKYTDAIINSFKDITPNIFNPLYIENPLIFATNNFVKVFERPEMEALINKDLNEYSYTYLNLTEQRLSNFQYMVYWLQELKNDKEPVSLDKNKFEKFLYYQYDTPEFDELIKKVQNYLSGGQRSLIQEIIDKIHEFPTINAANEKAKQQIDTVYRGVGFYSGEFEATEKEILKGEKERKYVATSTSVQSALNFTYMRGHLDSGRRSDYGYLLTYEVGPESIVLDTNIFGGKYFENEVIINTHKARLVDIEYSEGGEDEDY